MSISERSGGTPPPAGTRPPTAGEAETLARVADGDGAALGDLYDRFAGQVYSLARSVCADAGLAEDVTHEVFLAARNRGHRFDPTHGPVGTWLLTITHERAVAAARRQRGADRRRGTAADDTRPGPDGTARTDAEAVDPAAARRVRDLFARLPPDQARILGMAYYGGHSHADIAAILCVSVAAAGTGAALAVAHMRTAPAGPDGHRVCHPGAITPDPVVSASPTPSPGSPHRDVRPRHPS